MSPMFVPGPVDVHPDVLARLSLPMLPHRSREFEEIFRSASQKAQTLFYTQSRIFIITASGSGLHEAAIRNLAKSNVLSCVNGAFSKRWYDSAVANGKQVQLLETSWNQPLEAAQIAEAVQSRHFELVTLVHNETSTGLQNPVLEIAAAIKQASPDTLICVDAVSSLGGVKIEMDAWGLDMLLTSSQKCLALPPGIALAGVSDRAMAYAEQVPQRGWYFDLVLLEKHRLKDSTPATPALPQIFALDYQIDRILAEGLEARYARHAAMAKRVQQWALDRGFELYAPAGARSQTVTTIVNTHQLDVRRLNAFLAKKDMRIANGYGLLKDKTFRIAHMGDLQLSDVEALLAAMDEFLKQR